MLPWTRAPRSPRARRTLAALLLAVAAVATPTATAAAAAPTAATATTSRGWNDYSCKPSAAHPDPSSWSTAPSGTPSTTGWSSPPTW